LLAKSLPDGGLTEILGIHPDRPACFVEPVVALGPTRLPCSAAHHAPHDFRIVCATGIRG